MGSEIQQVAVGEIFGLRLFRYHPKVSRKILGNSLKNAFFNKGTGTTIKHVLKKKTEKNDNNYF